MDKKKDISKRPEQKDKNVDLSGSVTGSVIIDGSRAVKVGQDRSIDTGGGAYIGGDVSTGGGDFVGRDKIINIGLTGQELERLFTPMMDAVRSAPAEQQDEALQKVEALKNEVSKGGNADDSRVAKLIDGLVALVPGAVSAVVSTFASPLLAGVAGPVTKFMLDKLQGK